MDLEYELQEIAEQSALLRAAQDPAQVSGCTYALQMAIEGARLAGATDEQINQARK